MRHFLYFSRAYYQQGMMAYYRKFLTNLLLILK